LKSVLIDEILGKILSLVPTKVAASTSVLSKRWRNLLGLIDSLCFEEPEEAASGSHRFFDFVDKTFALLSESPIIKKLSLSLIFLQVVVTMITLVSTVGFGLRWNAVYRSYTCTPPHAVTVFIHRESCSRATHW
ncbi:unnamed protein product, partial [Brassica oleracea var. botrytis]